MAIWRDPLDELIDDLERVAPPPVTGLFPPEKLHLLTDAILYGNEAEAATLMADPEFQAWIQSLAGQR